MFRFAAIIGLFLLLGSAVLSAAAVEGIRFSHNDWEVACDNARTCRAAGYHSEEHADHAISVLLTRAAGPDQPVQGKVRIYQEDRDFSGYTLSLRVNDQDLGQVTLNKEQIADLTAAQVAALLKVLPGQAKIAFTHDQITWVLSDSGAAAVLLKMDEFQGRIGTPGALIKKGSKPEATVLPPVPLPALKVAALAKALPGDNQVATKHAKAVIAALRKVTPKDECEDLMAAENELSVTRLTKTKLLVSTSCWQAAYNMGYGYWVINDRAPYEPQLITSSGTSDEAGIVYSAMRDRGMGDCASEEQWLWNGKQFIHALSTSYGMCKGMLGGAWELPTLDYLRTQPKN